MFMTRMPIAIGALADLKKQLGLKARADFLTQWNQWPGDLIYPYEQVSIFLLSCLWYACPHHKEAIPSSWAATIQMNLVHRKKTNAFLKEHGWTSYVVFECQVIQNPAAIAYEIIRLLQASIPMATQYSDYAISKNTAIARLARADAATRVSDPAWRRFVETLNDAGRNYRKSDIHLALVRHEQWSEDAFNSLWAVAIHHGLIGYSTNGFAPGPYFKYALGDCAIVQGRNHAVRPGADPAPE